MSGDVRRRYCTRPGCPNLAYSARSGGLCYSHAQVFAAETMGEKVPNRDVARFLWPWVRMGYAYTTLFDAVGLKGSSTQFDRGCDMQAATFRRVQTLDVEECLSHPVWRTQRRLQALRAAGMRTRDMVRPGLSASTISKVCRGLCTYVTRDVHRAADELWQEHRDMPVTTPVPWMAKWGWRPPMAWDDIDDPQESHGSMGKIVQSAAARRFYHRHLRPVKEGRG